MSDLNPYANSPTATAVPPTQRSVATPFAVVLGASLLLILAILIGTGKTERFLWLFAQAAPWLIFAGPVTIPLLIWLESATKHAKSRDQLNALPLLWIAPLILMPIAMLTWGAVFAHPRGRGFMQWHLTSVQWAFYSTFIFAAFAVLFNEGRRSFVASLSLLLILFALFCSVTAGMSVTGDWL